jgi:hypothetical protein
MLLAWYSRTGWFREHQFGQRLAAGGFGKFCSPEQLSPANIRVNQNALAGVLSSDTRGNFLPAKDEMSVGAGLAPPRPACCKTPQNTAQAEAF